MGLNPLNAVIDEEKLVAGFKDALHVIANQMLNRLEDEVLDNYEIVVGFRKKTKGREGDADLRTGAAEGLAAHEGSGRLQDANSGSKSGG